MTAERQAIESPVAGEKPATSESELSSMSDFPPADVPRARRLCLSSGLFEWGTCPFQHFLRNKRWRDLCSSRAQVTGPGNRYESPLSKRFPGSVTPRPLHDGLGVSPHDGSRSRSLCVFAPLRYLRFVLGLAGGFVMPWCLGVFVVKYAVPGGYDCPGWQSYAF